MMMKIIIIIAECLYVYENRIPTKRKNNYIKLDVQ